MTLGRLFGTTVGRWELTIVVDSCTDNTLRTVVELLGASQQVWRELGLGIGHFTTTGTEATCGPELRPTLPLRIRVVVAPTPLFETRLENIAFLTSSPRVPKGFYVSVQGDMVMCELGWNYFLSLPARIGRQHGLVAVTARHDTHHQHDIFQTYEEELGRSADDSRRAEFSKVPGWWSAQ